MTFAPVLPLGGYAGWAFLKRTMAQQTAAFNAQPSVIREEAYFREKIGRINTAEQLVDDPRLLRVSLGAFGLDADIGNKFFIRKILEGGTLKADALANKLANKQYQRFSAAFGFGDFATPKTKLSDFADRILASYKNQQFSVAVGKQNDDMRLALNIERELPRIAASTGSPLSKWYTILGTPPLRAVFERAFALPASFGTIDIDRQAEIMRARSSASFGSADLGQFQDRGKMDRLIQQFFLQSELEQSGASQNGALNILTLFQQSPRLLQRL